jgi:hypothetical protein
MKEENMATRHPSESRSLTDILAGMVAAAALLAGCNGSATQTTTGQGLSGTLLGEDGRPAVGAEVAAWRANSQSPIGPGSVPAAMARTDAGGRYLLDLEAGTYNVFARDSGEARAAGIPGVAFASGELDLGESTLMPPGSASGRVIVGGAPAGEVFCFIPGSAFVAMTDTAGRFTLDRVPPGRYPLRYVGTGLAAVLDSVTVYPDSALALPDREMFPDVSLQPPAPAGLRAVQDTASGSVTLTWNPVEVADLADYVAEYRLAGDTGNWEKIGPVAGAEEKDTVRIHREAWSPFGQYEEILRGTGPIDSCRMEYRVKAVDKDGNSSAAYSGVVSVLLRRPPILRTEVRMDRLGGAGDSALCRDTLAFAASFTNPVVDSATFEWSVEHYLPRYNSYHTLYVPKMEGLEPKRAPADTLVWWWGRGFDSTDMRKIGPDAWETPDTLYVNVRVRIAGDFAGDFTYRRKVIDILRTSPGCYRVGPAREPRIDK